MAKVTIIPQIDNQPDFKAASRFIDSALTALITEMNGRLQFGDNISAVQATVIFPAATSTVTVVHSLRRVPSGFLVIKLDAAMTVYAPTLPPWTADKIYLRSSAIGTATLWII